MQLNILRTQAHLFIVGWTIAWTIAWRRAVDRKA